MHSHFLRCSIPYMLGLLVCIGISGNALAQTTTGEIRGVVTDASSGEPLVGAQVNIIDFKLGTTTNINGEYTLRRLAPGEYTLIAKYVGFKSVSRKVTVVAGESVKQDFAIAPTAVTADELIVTGQGVATERRKLTTAVESIDADRIAGSTARSVDQLLQGNVPGLTAYLPSGMPGMGARIQTRGVKSALGSTNPVIYVDGVRVDNGDNFAGAFGRGGQVSSALADLLVGDNIERVEVIKGGAATTLYGSDGANGVIQIFTKKGSAGEAKWTTGLQYGTDSPELRWLKEDYLRQNFFQQPFTQLYRLGVTGGSEALSYNINGRIQDSRGLIVGDRAPDRAFNIAAGLRAITSEKADVEISASVTRTQFGSAYLNNSFGPYSTIETEAAFEPFVLGVSRRIDVSSTPQRLGIVRDSLYRQFLVPEQNEQVTRPIVTLNFNYSPVKSFTNRFTVGIDYRYNEARDIVPVNPGEVFAPLGFINRSSRDFTQITLNYAGNYKFPELGPISSQIAFGFQGFRTETREIFASGTNIAAGARDFDNSGLITAGEINTQLFTGGLFINPQFTLNDRLILDIGFRVDGSTAFGQQINYLIYPKAGLAWNISDEPFYPEAIKPYITGLKLRAAVGGAGEFPPPFLRDRTFAVISYLQEATVTYGSFGNPRLEPAVTTAYDIGAELSLFQDRVFLEANWYLQSTRNSFFSVLQDAPTGFLAPQQTNLGEIRNAGIELSLRANVIQSAGVDLSIRASYSTLWNRATSLGNSPPFAVGGFAFAQTRLEENQPVGVIRVNVPRADADGIWRGGSNIALQGSALPTDFGSFGFDMTIMRDLSVTALAEFSLGSQLLNQWRSRRQVNAFGFRQIEAGNGQTSYPVYPEIGATFIRNPLTNNAIYNRDPQSQSLLMSGDWMKIREVTLRYRVPRGFFGGVFTNTTVSATVRNPVVIFANPEADPETQFIREARGLNVGGIVGGTVSAARQFRFGVDVNF